jgi:hypothetical protein
MGSVSPEPPYLCKSRHNKRVSVPHVWLVQLRSVSRAMEDERRGLYNADGTLRFL